MLIKILKLINNNNLLLSTIDKNKLLLKNILLNINKNRLLKNNNININNYNNNNNKLIKINNINNWNKQIYNYNKNNEINNIIKDNIISKLLIKLLSYKLIISKPLFKHNSNKLIIKFYYYYNNNNKNINNNNYYIDIISKYINIINNIGSLNNILSNYYNKKVIILPIKLKYIYNNNIIFNNNLINNININILINNIPKNNDKLISKLYLNNINNINKLKYNNIINNNKNIYNNININNIPINILIFKYLTGWSIIIKGRINNNISRTTTLNILQGTFNNKKYLWSNINNNYKLNYISANHNISNLSNINKNGKYNIKVKLNYI